VGGETESPMKGILGIGGIFFKCDDTEKKQQWYVEKMGLSADQDGFIVFPWVRPGPPSKDLMTVWSPFPRDTEYFKKSTASYMINYIVGDLDFVLADLREKGVEVDEETESGEFGRFGWAYDLEGVRFELWEPPKQKA